MRTKTDRKMKRVDQKIASLIKLAYVTIPDDDTGLDAGCQFEGLGKPLNAALYSPYGLSSNIPKGSTVILFANNGSSESNAGFGSYPENRFRNLKEWEIKIGNYKTKAHIFFKEDGQVLFNKDHEDSTDFMVRFSELKAGFDQVVKDLNALKDKYNSHIHTTTATVSTGSAGVIAKTGSVGVPSNADIDKSKIDQFNVPGVTPV